MNPPNNISLPFFAYGLFKPGQLCHFRISDLVKESMNCTVSGILKERDGIPLLILKENGSQIKGYLMHFFAGKEAEAYDRIIEIEPQEVYQWKKAKVNNSDANVLVGRRDDRGSSDLENVDEWDGSNDLYFNQALEEVETILKANSDSAQGDQSKIRSLLRLQMAYSLLWTAIERYAGLKYHLGKKVNKKVYKIEDEKCFADTLKKIVQQKRTVRSTTDLAKYTLDPDNPNKSIRYYYQVRSNAIHRGKAVRGDFDTMKASLEEMLFIFKEMLNESFRQ